MSHSTQSTEHVVYQETVWPSLLSTVPLAILVPSIALVVTPFTDFVVATLAGACAFVLALLTVLSLAPKIRISQGKDGLMLFVNSAVISSDYISKIELVDRPRVRAERGPLLDARSFRAFQPSVEGMVKIQISDESDRTPYWIFSTRNPKAIAEALKK